MSNVDVLSYNLILRRIVIVPDFGKGPEARKSVQTPFGVGQKGIQNVKCCVAPIQSLLLKQVNGGRFTH